MLAAALLAAAAAGPVVSRRWLVPLGFGLLTALAQPDDLERVAARVDLARPVALVGRVDSAVQGTAEARRLWLRVELVAQTGAREPPRTEPLRFELLLTLPDGEDSEVPSWLAPGSRIRVRGHLGRLWASANPGVAGDGPWTLRLESWRFLEPLTPPPRTARIGAGIRARLRRALDEARADASTGSRDPGIGLVQALVLGDASELPERWRRGLRAGGSVHVLSVSGLHVGLVATGLWVLASGLAGPRGRVVRCALCLAGVGAYLLVVGPRPAVLRAAGMAAVALASLLVARPPLALHALSLAVTGLVATRPDRVDALGFQLSVAATLALLLVAPSLARRWRRGFGESLPRVLVAALAAATAAQLATAPFLLRLGGGLHPATPLVDLVLLPWLAASLALAMAWSATALLLHPADPLLDLLSVAARPLEWLAEAPASPWRRLSIPALVALVALPGSLLMGRLEPDAARDLAPELIALDVGQGDALLLRDGPHAVLIDGGGWRRGDPAARILVPTLDALGVHRLDAIVLTHPDVDHCNGLDALGPYLEVAEVWAAPGWAEACAAAVVTRRGRSWRPLWRGERERVGRWRLDVLWPPPALRGRMTSNGRSLVVRASAGAKAGLSGVAPPTVLLAADIEARTEAELVRWARATPGATLKADVLKLAHHGSRSSSSRAFLQAVAPRWALVSAGVGNRYGHPHGEVLDRLEVAGVRVLRVDRSGQVRLRLPATGRASPASLGLALPSAPRSQRALGLDNR